MAQVPGSPAAGGGGEDVSASPRKQLATIIFAGLAGSILGLSTLSFYGRPQDKLANIAIGFALGVLSGFVYVTYTAVEDPNKFYGGPSGDEKVGLQTDYLYNYRIEQYQRFNNAEKLVPTLSYRWQF